MQIINSPEMIAHMTLNISGATRNNTEENSHDAIDRDPLAISHKGETPEPLLSLLEFPDLPEVNPSRFECNSKALLPSWFSEKKNDFVKEVNQQEGIGRDCDNRWIDGDRREQPKAFVLFPFEIQHYEEICDSNVTAEVVESSNEFKEVSRVKIDAKADDLTQQSAITRETVECDIFDCPLQSELTNNEEGSSHHSFGDGSTKEKSVSTSNVRNGLDLEEKEIDTS